MPEMMVVTVAAAAAAAAAGVYERIVERRNIKNAITITATWQITTYHRP